MATTDGQHAGPILILHGGAGPRDPKGSEVKRATEELIRMGQSAISSLGPTQPPLKAVMHCLRAMERSPTFNAGIGSALQADGQVRMTAAVMDSLAQRFSAAHGASHMVHPSEVALELQNMPSRMVSSPGTELLARRLQIPEDDVLTERRVDAWVKDRRQAATSGGDTVGCAVRSGNGSLAAGTSTGGRGNEFPGRMSDSGTPCGNFVSSNVAVSATGVGEHIVDDALAARLVTRCDDGLELVEACNRCEQEAKRRNHQYGWIACDQRDRWAVSWTTQSITYAVLTWEGEILGSS